MSMTKAAKGKKVVARGDGWWVSHGKAKGEFIAYWHDSSRKQFQKRFPGRAARQAAKQHAEAQRNAVREGTYVDPSRGRVTFKKFASKWIADIKTPSKDENTLKPHTVAGYESILDKHLLPEFGHKGLAAIGPPEVKALFTRLKGELSSSRVRSVYFLLRQLMREAVEDGYIVRSPVIGVKLPKATSKEIQPRTAEEVRKVSNAVPARYRALILVLAYAGLRWGEAVALRRRSFNFLKAQLHVTRSLADVNGKLIFGPTKTHASRYVRIPPFLVQILAEHLENVDTNPDALIFTSPEGAPLRLPNWRRRTWFPALDDSNIPRFRIHDLRHTCASLLIAKGAHPKAVQAHLGHESITTTLDRYGHLYPDAMDALSTALNDTYEASATHVDSL